MSESGDYEPEVWTSHDSFSNARQAYDAQAGRSYAQAQAQSKEALDLLPAQLETLCHRPLILGLDNTGSMQQWPGIVVGKGPYFYNEVKHEYLGEDAEVCVAAIGDARNNEKYPCQARPFTKGEAIKTAFGELVLEGLGGGNGGETYELLALYLARNVHMPNAVKPIVIFIADEQPFPVISADHAARFARVTTEKSLQTRDVFAELKAKYAVYLIQKPYGGGGVNDAGQLNDNTSKQVHRDWLQYLDEDHIAILGDPERVVDVIFGILAQETDRVDYFRAEITERQLKDKGGERKIATAYKALNTIHANQPEGSGKSRMHKPLMPATQGRKLLPSGK